MELGSLADIVTAATAIGALLAAVIGARQARRLFAVEANRDERAADRERQHQASQVFAWVASRIVDDEPRAYGAVVVNSSDQAIYDVAVRVAGASGAERRPIELTILPPGAYYLEESAEAYGWEFASRLRSFTAEIRPVTKSRRRSIREMSFRDSSNLTWRRDATGILSALEEAAAGGLSADTQSLRRRRPVS